MCVRYRPLPRSALGVGEQAEQPQTLAQRVAIDAEQARRLQLVAAGEIERVAQERALDAGHHVAVQLPVSDAAAARTSDGSAAFTRAWNSSTAGDSCMASSSSTAGRSRMRATRRSGVRHSWFECRSKPQAAPPAAAGLTGPHCHAAPPRISLHVRDEAAYRLDGKGHAGSGGPQSDVRRPDRASGRRQLPARWAAGLNREQ